MRMGLGKRAAVPSDFAWRQLPRRREGPTGALERGRSSFDATSGRDQLTSTQGADRETETVADMTASSSPSWSYSYDSRIYGHDAAGIVGQGALLLAPPVRNMKTVSARSLLQVAIGVIGRIM